MQIVIAGAGGVGQYVASMLAKEEHDVTLIDTDAELLEKVSWSADVATLVGSATDWQLLDDLLESQPSFFIALTASDEVNLTACACAKKIGLSKTIARVRGERYLNPTRLDFSHIFYVDYFVSPSLLVANNIVKFIMSPGSLAIETLCSWRRSTANIGRSQHLAKASNAYF